VKLEDIPEAIGLTLEEKLGLEVIVEPTGPEKKEAHLRLMFGGADFQTEDEGMGTEQVEAHFVLTIQSKGPGNKTWLKKVMNASNKIARTFISPWKSPLGLVGRPGNYKRSSNIGCRQAVIPQ